MPKVREVIRRLEREGWRIKTQRGSHRQYVHSQKPGKVTVPGYPNDQLPAGTWNSIEHQAGWK